MRFWQTSKPVEIELFDNPRPEERSPEAVCKDTGSERVVLRHKPLGGIEPVRRLGRELGQHFRKARI